MRRMTDPETLVNKADVATINGQSLINGGNIKIGGTDLYRHAITCQLGIQYSTDSGNIVYTTNCTILLINSNKEACKATNGSSLAQYIAKDSSAYVYTNLNLIPLTIYINQYTPITAIMKSYKTGTYSIQLLQIVTSESTSQVISTTATINSLLQVKDEISKI